MPAAGAIAADLAGLHLDHEDPAIRVADDDVRLALTDMAVVAAEPANTVEDRDVGPQDRAQPIDHEALSHGTLRHGGGRGVRAGGGRSGADRGVRPAGVRPAGSGGHVGHSVIHVPRRHSCPADIRAPFRRRLGLGVAGVIVASAVSDAIVIVRVAGEHATAQHGATH